MINEQLIRPQSIVVIGGSNDIRKPGGKVLKNLLDGGYAGELYVTNLKEDVVQGLQSFRDVTDLPFVELAIVAIAARFVPDAVAYLAREKGTRAFIVLSAGFSEESMDGTILEQRLVDIVDGYGAALIGPNCIGVLTPHYHGVFTLPIPELDGRGCDLVSGSGATACFIMESGMDKGLRFSNVFSVGNSAQIGVEEVLQYLDDHFDPESSSLVKLLYIESIEKPEMLLQHASSLVRKGCRIAAIKAGSSDAGSRAASSHTGALSGSDVAVDALFRKAGIIRCHSREELISIASVCMYPPLKGRNIAVITHAGGPAVMLTDALEKGGLVVPHIESPNAYKLLEKLHPGSSVANPIDFLATGTAVQLGQIIDFVDNELDDIDGMVVIYGTPGLFPVFDAYDVLDKKMQQCKKPVFPVLPSTITAREEVASFVSRGRVIFSDEVQLGKALAKVANADAPAPVSVKFPGVDIRLLRDTIETAGEGYLSPREVQDILDAAGIARVPEAVASDLDTLLQQAKKLGYPLALKVVGPVHKSDVGGVALDIHDEQLLLKEYERMMHIPGAEAVLIQPMLSGIELFAGVKREEPFGHLLFCGMGGIYIEVLKDVSSTLAPVAIEEARQMVRRLKSHPVIAGMRGKPGADEEAFAHVLLKLSALLFHAPEIDEMDINPLIGTPNSLFAVDARISLSR